MPRSKKSTRNNSKNRKTVILNFKTVSGGNCRLVIYITEAIGEGGFGVVYLAHLSQKIRNVVKVVAKIIIDGDKYLLRACDEAAGQLNDLAVSDCSSDDQSQAVSSSSTGDGNLGQAQNVRDRVRSPLIFSIRKIVCHHLKTEIQTQNLQAKMKRIGCDLSSAGSSIIFKFQPEF